MSPQFPPHRNPSTSFHLRSRFLLGAFLLGVNLLSPRFGVAAPEARQSRTAPYFLLERVRAMGDSGVVGLPAGAKVEVLSKTPAGLKVKTADGIVFEIGEAKVTQDPAQAESARQQAIAKEAEAKAKRDALFAEAKAQNLARLQKLQAAMEGIVANAPEPTPTPESAHTPLTGSSLDGGPKSAGVVVHLRPKPTPSASPSKSRH